MTKTLQKISVALAIASLGLAVLYFSGGMDDPIGAFVRSWHKAVGRGGT